MQLARHVAYTATGVAIAKIKSDKDYFFGETEEYRMHMICQPNKKFLCAAESALTRGMAERIGTAAKKKGKTAQKDEIVDEDLFSPYSTVCYILTKDALREGWDCSFACLLCWIQRAHHAH